jgi:type IV pilus assembly protein PilY1
MDMNLDYQTNAVYLGQTYDASGVWKGKLLRLFISTPDTELYPAPNAWSASVLATTKDEQPITAPPGIAADHNSTPWVFWGTGRFFSGDDKLELSTQSFYGVKDRTLAEGSPAEGKGPADLTEVSNVVVTFGEPSTVTGSPAVMNGSSWDEMLNSMRGDEVSPSYGWYLDVTDIWGPNAGERVLVKPSIFGGLVMFTSFKPQADICDRGGQGRLYALYYETGTAFRGDSFGLSDPPLGTMLERSVDLGLGRPSGVGLHIGQEKGGKIFVQQSTGIIEELLMKTPLRMKGGLVCWYED